MLTPQEAEDLFATLRAMAAEGRAVIFISHKLHEVMAVADRVTVLRGGRSIATVRTADVTRRELAALMVGRDVELGRRREPAEIGDVVLDARGLTARRRPGRRRAPRRLARPSAPARWSASPASRATASGSWRR